MGSAAAAGGSEATFGAGGASGIILAAVSLGTGPPGEISLRLDGRTGRFGVISLIGILVCEPF